MSAYASTGEATLLYMSLSTLSVSVSDVFSDVAGRFYRNGEVEVGGNSTSGSLGLSDSTSSKRLEPLKVMHAFFTYALFHGFAFQNPRTHKTIKYIISLGKAF